MYNVIIAEDELFVRLGIKNSVDWAGYGMQVLADAEDGLAAWERMQGQQVDVVITDILMPRMDGKQLISKIRAAGMDPYIIVITCLEDFHLIKNLLNDGIRDYILKASITEEELGKCMGKAKRYLDKYSPVSERRGERVLTSEEVCSRLMQRYLLGQAGFTETQEQLAANGVKIGVGRTLFALGMVEAAYDDQGNTLPELSGDIFQNLMDLLRSQSHPGYCCYSFLLEHQRFILLLQEPQSDPKGAFREPAAAVMDKIHSALGDYLNISLTLFLFDENIAADGIRRGYKKGLSLLEYHYLHPLNSVIAGWDDHSRESIGDVAALLDRHEGWLRQNFGQDTGEEYRGLLNRLIAGANESRDDMIFAVRSISGFVGRLLGTGMERLPYFPYQLQSAGSK